MSYLHVLINQYCDLTEGQYWDLKQAAAGKLEKINGARHQVMAEMIGPDLRATAWGLEILERARKIENDEWIAAEHDNDEPESWARAAGWVRKYTSLKKVRSVHLKAMWALHKRPGEAFNWLSGIYGYQSMLDLLGWDLAIGSSRRGQSWNLSAAGKELVRVFMIRSQKDHPGQTNFYAELIKDPGMTEEQKAKWFKLTGLLK